MIATKLCPGCECHRPRGEFYRGRSRHDGLQSRCKSCQGSPSANGRKRQRMRQHRRENPDVYRERARRERLKGYGLTVADFEALLIEQDGRCGGCGDPLLKPAVDHDHATGAVRGLLCIGCNTALGLLRDDPARILGLLAYLEE